jgi:uncharacterized membrane protein YeaQ/YmgE (transglycosylase-associated protein family)
MWFIISSLLCGFVAGLIARALVTGPGPRGCLPTTALGIVGSLTGGFLGYLIFDQDLGEGALQPAGLIGSVIGAVLVLFLYRWRARR